MNYLGLKLLFLSIFFTLSLVSMEQQPGKRKSAYNKPGMKETDDIKDLALSFKKLKPNNSIKLINVIGNIKKQQRDRLANEGQLSFENGSLKNVLVIQASIPLEAENYQPQAPESTQNTQRFKEALENKLSMTEGSGFINFLQKREEKLRIAPVLQKKLKDCVKLNDLELFKKLLVQENDSIAFDLKQIWKTDSMYKEIFNSCLTIACNEGQVEFVKFIIEDIGIDCNFYSNNRPIWHGAALNNQAHVSQWLLNNKYIELTYREKN